MTSSAARRDQSRVKSDDHLPSALIFDDHRMVVDGLIRSLSTHLKVVDVGHSRGEVVRLVTEWKPDLILLDIFLGSDSGIDIIPEILAVSPHSKIMVLTGFDHPGLQASARKGGASGFLVKGCERTELITAINAVLRGETYFPQVSDQLSSFRVGDGLPDWMLLTPLRQQIVLMIGWGKTTAQIAERLGVSHRTIEDHRDQIRRRLGLKGIHDLGRYAAMAAAKYGREF